MGENAKKKTPLEKTIKRHANNVKTHHSDAGEARTRGPSVSSQAHASYLKACMTPSYLNMQIWARGVMSSV